MKSSNVLCGFNLRQFKYAVFIISYNYAAQR